ncbi:[Fe-Fe] hydrogenase large subunit C-terminal domain-containing protein [Saccharicrinis sp. FJH2]|uniref:[Fe-Fe] hydrogenase large subunit C-terminal domain-containing protein n=1 Tax=Saccharicrinis sp. FJH65 TaxID=3344659 RepID=UPI0035F401E6
MKGFFHAIEIDYNKCIGCAHCMKACPTEAIRIVNGKADLSAERCVDCGECFRVCPVDAYSVVHDDMETMMQFDCRVALIPSVFYGQFPSAVPPKLVRKLMKDIGFTHIYGIEAGVNLLRDQINKQVDKAEIKPLISSFCPAVVRTIQVKFPSLVDNIIHLKAPADVAAEYYREKLHEEGFDKNRIGIFYLTPCAAKIAAIKSPVGEEKSQIDGVININTVYNKLLKILKTENPPIPDEVEENILDDISIRWPLTNGEAKHIKGRSLSIDGIRNTNAFLEKVENDEMNSVNFLELRMCDESCAGGILNCDNRFLIVERLNNRVKEHRDRFQEKNGPTVRNFNDKADYLTERIFLNQPIEPRSIVLDEDMVKAMKKMQRARDLMCYLPGIDCGACGAPTCRTLAEDIVNRKANLSHCIFMQRQMEKHKKLSPDHAIKIIEKVWGKSRLDKDCTKKGAKNENI